MMIRRPFVLCLSFVALTFLMALSARAEVLGEYKFWVATKVQHSGQAVCLMSSSPQKDEGNYTQRGEIFAIITHRPSDSITGEVSFQAGYPHKQDSSVSVMIDGKSSFSLFTKGEFSWTRERADDRALVQAMRAGNTMVVKGTSSRGTLTTDTYSLSGFTAAYNAISKACGVQ